MAYIIFGDLRIPATEQFGPKTNSRTVAILHPDMYQTSQDIGRTRVIQRQVDKSTWLPNQNLGNLVMKDVFVVDADGHLAQRPYIVNQPSAPGAPLAAVSDAYDSEVVQIKTGAEAVYVVGQYGNSEEGVPPEPPTTTYGVAQEEGKVLAYYDT
jgi:hypothetical protein